MKVGRNGDHTMLMQKVPCMLLPLASQCITLLEQTTAIHDTEPAPNRVTTALRVLSDQTLRIRSKAAKCRASTNDVAISCVREMIENRVAKITTGCADASDSSWKHPTSNGDSAVAAATEPFLAGQTSGKEIAGRLVKSAVH